MKNTEVFENREVLRNIPLEVAGAKLGGALAAKLILMRVAYDKAVKSFEDDMQEALKAMKPEGFDERSEKIRKMEDTDRRSAVYKEWLEKGSENDRPEPPTEEESKEADEIRTGKEAYDKELEELNSQYMEARTQKLNEECPVKFRTLTEKELGEIIDVMGTQGTMKITWGANNDIDMDRTAFIGMIAEKLVE